MTIDAVALLRIPDWEPDDDLDTRPLDDAHLLYLEVPFDAPPEHVLAALEEILGYAVFTHLDPRGLLILPDAADTDGAQTYEQVVAAVGDLGVWIALDDAPVDGLEPADLRAMLDDGVRAVLDDTLASLGLGSVEEMQRMLQEQDPEAMRMAQNRMQNALGAAMQKPSGGAPSKGEGPVSEPPPSGERETPLGAQTEAGPSPKT